MQDGDKLLLAGGLLLIAGFLNFTRQGQQFSQSIGAAIAGGIMNISDAGLQIIRNFEGFSPNPYKDAGGWSIGYGHYMGAKPTMQSVTKDQAENLLVSDTGKAVNAITKFVKVPLTQNQFDALVSFTYNVGVGAFLGSTLLTLLNRGDYTGASAQFSRWNKSQGKVNATLTARRASEQTLFNT